mmetsp:Transcript_1237/g.2742  ORF Transcript_1237/g.2742 Transcript_1237/m.2742 type:complete len:208 (-) Transcript_1237:164-787(-)
MISIAVIISSNIHHIFWPVTQCFPPSCPCSWKGCNCDSPMTIARPLQKPSMTEAGTSVMNLYVPVSQMRSMKAPHVITDGNSNSMPAPFPPCWAGGGIMVAMMAAKAPSAPFTIPVLPPNRLQIKPTTHAAWIAMCGFMCAMKAKATDSGIWAKQMVMPNRTSFLTKLSFSCVGMALHSSSSKNSDMDGLPTNHSNQLSSDQCRLLA